MPGATNLCTGGKEIANNFHSEPTNWLTQTHHCQGWILYAYEELMASKYGYYTPKYPRVLH